MEWYNILSIVLGAIGGIGGISGLISIYNAKSNKDTIDIANYRQLLEDIKAERDDARMEYTKYHEMVDKKVEEVKTAFENLKKENEEFKKSILQAYRCTLPAKIEDCPVIKLYETIEKTCLTCNHKEEE